MITARSLSFLPTFHLGSTLTKPNWKSGDKKAWGAMHGASLPGHRAGREAERGGWAAVVDALHNTEGQFKHNSLVLLEVTILCIHRKQSLFSLSSDVPLIIFVTFLWVLLLPLIKFKIWSGVLKENQINKNRAQVCKNRDCTATQPISTQGRALLTRTKHSACHSPIWKRQGQRVLTKSTAVSPFYFFSEV